MNQINQNSTRLEILAERFNKEQTQEATDSFMELVIAICDQALGLMGFERTVIFEENHRNESGSL